MKKIVQREIIVCDVCEEECPEYSLCHHCYATYCWDHSEELVHYTHGVWSSGGGDGCYCLSCDATLTKSRTDPRHNALRALVLLREEGEVWRREFKRRAEAAEALLPPLILRKPYDTKPEDS